MKRRYKAPRTRLPEPGVRRGMLTVLGLGRAQKSYRGWFHTTVRVRCDCGVHRTITTSQLLRYRSCGCRKGKKPGSDAPSGLRHGHKRRGRSTPEYHAWRNMLARCYDKHVKEYKNYGARGIRVTPRWKRFENFIADMGHKPSRRHSLDRKNNHKGYSRTNCRWATRIEQDCNKRTNVKITIAGERRTAAEWTRRFALPPFRIYSRLRAGWSPRDAVLREKNFKRRR